MRIGGVLWGICCIVGGIGGVDCRVWVCLCNWGDINRFVDQFLKGRREVEEVEREFLRFYCSLK